MIDGCDVDLVGEAARNGGAVNADDTARSVVSMAIVDFSMVCSLLCSVAGGKVQLVYHQLKTSNSRLARHRALVDVDTFIGFNIIYEIHRIIHEI